MFGILLTGRAGAADSSEQALTQEVGGVTLAGPADRQSDILRKQVAGKLPPPLAQDNERILASLERGETAAEVPPVLAAWYRPSVQPYLISVYKFVPAREIATLRAPVLIVQGTTDIQVGVDQARALKAARPDAVLLVVPGMNHVLKAVPANVADPVASYGDPGLPLHPQLAPAIVDFVRGLPGPGISDVSGPGTLPPRPAARTVR